jgi:large subunit ribosomal protein L25
MEQVVLEAARRQESGKGVARKLRSAGSVPAVVYGMGKEPIALSVAKDVLDRLLSHSRGGNLLCELLVDGEAVESGVAALLKSVQRHPVTRAAESADFQWVSLTEEITVSVQVVLEGDSEAAKSGAAVDQILYTVDVTCTPLSIPQQLAISIEGLELHETRTVSMLQVPDGVVVLADPEEPVVTCTPPMAIEVETEEVPEEGELLEVGAEGAEEGAAAADDEEASSE